MKRKLKRILSLILSLILVLGCCSPAFAVQAEEAATDYSVKLTSDKSSYAKGEKIVLTATASNTGEETKDITVSVDKTAFIGTEIVQFAFSNVKKGVDKTKTITAQADYFTLKDQKLKKLTDFIAGDFQVLLFQLIAAIKPNTECVIVDIDGAKAAILYSYKAIKSENRVNHTVKFDLNYDGAVNDIPNQTILEGELATEPNMPLRDGYYFAGWAEEKNSDTYFDFNTPVLKDTTLYAQWNENTYVKDHFKVTFVLNDGSAGAYAMQEVKASGRAAKPADPKSEGFDFTGWYTEPEALNKFNFTTRIVADTVIYAGWAPKGGSNGPSTTESGGGTIFSITDIEITNGKANVTINVNEMSALVLRFMDENTDEVFHTISIATPDYGELTKITLPIDTTLPKYFKVKASLYDEDGVLRCNEYTTIKYTAKFEQFKKLTVNDFDGKNVLNFDNNPNNNFGVLADGVILINQSIAKNVLKTTYVDDPASNMLTEYYVFSKTDAQVQGIKINDVIYAKDTNGEEKLFKVGAVEFDANGNCTLKPSSNVEISEFYTVLKVDTEKLVKSKVGPQTYADVADVDVTITVPIPRADFKWDFAKNGNVQVTVDFDLSVKLKFFYDLELFGKDYMEASIEGTAETTAKIDVEASVDNGDKVEKGKKEFDVGKYRIPTTIAGLSVVGKISVPIELSASAKGIIEYKGTNVSGFKYDTNSGRQSIDKKERTFKAEFEGEAEIKFGPKIGIGVSFCGEVWEATVNLSAGVKATATATSNLQGTDADEIHACGLCIKLEAKFYVTVGASLEYKLGPISGKPFDEDIVNVEGIILFGNFDSAYLSVLHGKDSCFGSQLLVFGFGTCPNKKYKVTIKVKDLNGNDINGNNVTIKNLKGKLMKEGPSPLYHHLYPGKYILETKIGDKDIRKTISVEDKAQEVVLDENSKDGKISGKILSEKDKTPLADVTILIKQNNHVVERLSSDANGQFSINIPDGVFLVEITKEGYLPFSQYVTIEKGSEQFLQTSLLIGSSSSVKGGISGIITNAVNGSPVSNVKVDIREGWDSPKSTSIIKTVYTDRNGKYDVPLKDVWGIKFGLAPGNYTITLSRNGFAETSFNVVIIANTAKLGQNHSISPNTDGNYRVVLHWGSSPSDLDSHFTAETLSGSYTHVYYGSRNGSCSNLDRDDTSSYGPETITVTDFNNLKNGFTYTVHDYTNKYSTDSKSLSNSGAYVELYSGSVLLKTYHVPTDMVGTAWRVFSIDANGNIIDKNQLYNQSSPSAVN